MQFTIERTAAGLWRATCEWSGIHVTATDLETLRIRAGNQAQEMACASFDLAAKHMDTGDD